MKKKIIYILALVLIAFSFFSLFSNSKQEKIDNVSVTPVAQKSVVYKGEQGKEALAILKQKYSVVQEASGLVIGIGGIKADSKSREYWAFYVNGKMANIGAADYKTKDSDLIEWKVEKY